MNNLLLLSDKNLKKLTTALLLSAMTGTAWAQTNTFPTTGSVGIGTTAPAASSLLEVKSTTKGFLLPRMTKTQRDVITSPATGLLIYQTNSTPGFYYYSGTAWTAMKPSYLNKTLSNLTAPTAINASLLPGSNNAVALGSAAKSWKDIYFDGSVWLGGSKFINVPSANSMGIGFNALGPNFGGS